MERNPYFDLLPNGTKVFVANQEDFWNNESYQKMHESEQLYYQERPGIIIEFVEASRPRYRGYKVQLESGEVVQHNVGLIRLPDEKYVRDMDHAPLEEVLDKMATAHLRPDPLPSAQPGVADFITITAPKEGDRW